MQPILKQFLLLNLCSVGCGECNPADRFHCSDQQRHLGVFIQRWVCIRYFQFDWKVSEWVCDH